MELRQLGRSGVRVSRLALGTMTWGRDTDEHEAAEQLRFFLDAGGNFIDTAAVYGNGDAERVLGGFLGVMVPRDEIVIATKAGISFKNGERIVDNSRTSLIADLDRSLSHLRSEYVDLWQIHTWDQKTPLEEVLSALDYAVTTGRARHVGISNFAAWQLARSVTLQNPIFGKAPIISTQNEYSLLNRRIEGEILPASRELGVGVLAWSPLGRGVLTGKYRSGLPSDSRGASPHFSSFIEPYLDERSRKIVEAVMVASDGLGLSPLEVSLAWVRDCPGVTSAIIGARTGAQLRGALSAESVTLPIPVREALDEISAN
ncbi:MAG: aldo/keto reductase [Actinobacteria bacterium BACL2 MAG-120820-bin50]|jgi:aryl-alcohol dehydrogenase-like predicted oxidoreductase|uniref:Aldo/keto reductase n=1 Tax=Actinobacteria bacterium BACL2 MAG-120820-bin50 TaxID=1655570 RepID=A0A0R2QIU6_9ACTN|nr:MAG: aldo/keto reductase [Actinobacteria bacterium BACL2 MAG-120820-bin50]MDP4652796.1 aldo/keto reductase [Candidatus Nanopelagicales bacterium]MDP4864890.1 aldo/keto reductase [Candidatus Nanopelagicaceae bacterium]MDP5046032.1 aldo/keto reductase [Candidatus Nanopelagicaceae bacterium]